MEHSDKEWDAEMKRHYRRVVIEALVNLAVIVVLLVLLVFVVLKVLG